MVNDLFKPSTFTKKREHTETPLHIAVVNYLRGEIKSGRNTIKIQTPFPGLMFLHPVNEFKDEKEAFWAKAKGILPGAADLLFWWRDVFHVNMPKFAAIELKTDKPQSTVQKEFERRFVETGGRYAICRKVSEVRDQLIEWGLPCKNTQCIEPKLTHNQLLALSAEMYKP